MNPDPNPNRDNPNNLLDTIIVLGYNVRIEWICGQALINFCTTVVFNLIGG